MADIPAPIFSALEEALPRGRRFSSHMILQDNSGQVTSIHGINGQYGLIHAKPARELFSFL